MEADLGGESDMKRGHLGRGSVCVDGLRATSKPTSPKAKESAVMGASWDYLSPPNG